MNALARTLRLPHLGPSDGNAMTAAAACVLAALIGFAVSAGQAVIAVALIGCIAAFLVGLADWRFSVTALLAYIPVSGLLTLALFPQTGPGVLAKDFLFVLPAYAGFFGSYVARREPIGFPGPPFVLIAMLATLVVAQAFNPALLTPLVGLVGIKVWLLYVPMIFIGYHLIRDREDLDRILKVMCLAAILPALIGIFEAVLIYGGKSALVYSFYGDAAETATQGFAELEIGTATLLRVPSTFSYVAQYYVFVTCMTALAYAWWRMAGGGSAAARGRLAVFVLMLLAVLTSGSRGAFVFVPLLILVMLLIEGRVGIRAVGIVSAIAGGFALVVALIGTDVGTLASHLKENASAQWDLVVVEGIRESTTHLFAGLGTGADTNAARYVVNDAQQFSAIGGWQESWWAKSALELGIAGFLLAAALFATLIGRGMGLHRRLRDPGLRAISAAIIALIIWTAAYGVKAQYLDFDPLNVYFWFLVGILFRLPSIDKSEPPTSPAVAAEPPTAARKARSWQSATPSRP